jgi:hypothetical protein
MDEAGCRFPGQGPANDILRKLTAIDSIGEF